MPSAAYYRVKARECLALAELAKTEKEAERLREEARNNFALAEMLGPNSVAVEDEKRTSTTTDGSGRKLALCDRRTRARSNH